MKIKHFNLEVDVTDFASNFFEGVIITDANGQIQYINQASLNFFSTLTLSDLIGKSIYQFIFSKELERFYNNQQQMRNISLQIGLNQLLANFKIIDANIFLITLKNVTQIHFLNNELQEAQEQIRLFNQVLDYSSDGICFITNDENIIFYNKKMGELNSKEPDGVRNKKYETILHKGESQTDLLLNSLKTERELVQHESFFASDGKKYNVVRRSQPLFLGNKKIGALSVVKDYSETNEALDNILHLQKKDSTASSDCKMGTLSTFVYAANEMRLIVEEAKRAIDSTSHVLIHGPRGVGKSLLVDDLFKHSSEVPFYNLHCGAIAEHLLDKALFGQRDENQSSETTGLFEAANGGTIFLDEIDTVSLSLQHKILEVIRNKSIVKTKSLTSVPIDVRIIATMSVPPATAYEENLVVEELLYYLSAVSLKIPSLKDRKEDIPLYIDHFKQQAEIMAGQEPKKMHQNTMELLVNYDYPGNVRQLKYIIESAVSLVQDHCEILPEHLPSYIKNVVTSSGSSTVLENPFDKVNTSLSLTEQVEAFEKKLIHRVLKKTNYHITNSAEALGLSRQSLNYKIKKYELPIIRGGD